MTNPETLQFLRLHANDDPSKLALQARKYTDVDMPFVIRQISGRKVAAEKVPSWADCEEILYPPHLSMEQCSSEATARYKATLVEGETFVDLTGGFGIDCAFVSGKFNRAGYVERNPELCQLAAHNFQVLGLNQIETHNADAREHLEAMDKVDCIYIDPARRDGHGGKTVAVADCEPNVAQLSPLLLQKADRVMIKLSPMLDISLALEALPDTAEVHIVSVGNECKELLFILKNEKTTDVRVTCINLTKTGIQKFSFTKKEEQQSGCAYTQEVEKYLCEPNASLLKGGAYKIIAASFGLKKLHPNSHLYTSAERPDGFPGRVFVCESLFSLNKTELKQGLNGILKANVSIRNFPLSVADLRKRLKLSDGGDIYIFATTLADERKVLIRCQKESN